MEAGKQEGRQWMANSTRQAVFCFLPKLI